MLFRVGKYDESLKPKRRKRKKTRNSIKKGTTMALL